MFGSMSMTESQLFQVIVIGEVRVVELALPDSIDIDAFDRLNLDILALTNEPTHRAWVLDLSKVNYMGSATLGLLVNLRQRIRTAGGRLVICGMSQQLYATFHATSMERLFTVVGTRAHALELLR